MASHPTPAWVEASQLLPAAGDPKDFAHPIHQWQQVHSDADTDVVHRPGHYHHPPSCPGGPAHQSTFLQKLSATWAFELLALLVSATGLAAMSYVLRRYDGQRIPDWGSLSFNTLISILAVVSKMAALGFGFTEHGKNVIDYKTFDSGSRGVAGAAQLAGSFKGRSVATVGALAIILGAAADPFAQQVVHFYDHEYVDVSQAAWIARADIVDSLGPKMDSSTWSLDPIFKANAITALFLPTQEALLQPRLNCPTGNCTWAPFSTLGFCSTCADLSSQLNRTCETHTLSDNVTAAQACTVAFPGENKPLSLFYLADLDFPGSSTYMVLNSTLPANSIALRNITWPQTIYQSIRAVVPPLQLGGTQNPYLEAGGELANSGVHVLHVNTRFIASECALSPCVRRVQPSVAGGEYHEKVLDAFSDFGEYRSGGSIVLSPPWEAGRSFTLHPAWLNAVTATFLFGGQDPLGGQLLGTVTTEDSNQAIRVSDIPAFGASHRQNDALQAVFYANFTGTTCPTPDDNVACSFRALGAAMTKSVRDTAVSRNGTAAPYAARGDVHATGTYIRIEWPWFALPAAIWLLSLFTVVVAMWRSRGVPLWTDSALPLEAALSARAQMVKVHLAGEEGSGLRILIEGH
ncbi:hypothetical protein C8A05DRAFT_43556 [Staphylotrichum tortipilum]|uniref:Uncharacterized protein n=1 Tax=Staphylotrichum tortipilum TaxID=2831512 RepID=A0AAN6MMS8_9PEZI|nr:hypothetical protein C8A05DRAFT_43556 [Staphylotrichum longicolle]